MSLRSNTMNTTTYERSVHLAGMVNKIASLNLRLHLKHMPAR